MQPGDGVRRQVGEEPIHPRAAGQHIEDAVVEERCARPARR
jgi:hypothetical protein